MRNRIQDMRMKNHTQRSQLLNEAAGIIEYMAEGRGKDGSTILQGQEEGLREAAQIVRRLINR